VIHSGNMVYNGVHRFTNRVKKLPVIDGPNAKVTGQVVSRAQQVCREDRAERRDNED
jgi:hypothetical protein